jgi:hypothetical protein
MKFHHIGSALTLSLQIWDQGNNRFGAVPKIEKTQHVDLPSSSS